MIAPRLAEHPDVLLPVLVCQDGFTITHSAEPVDAAPRRRRSARFVGDYRIPHSVLDVAQPDDAGAVRDAGLLLRVPPPAGGRDRGLGDSRSASWPSEFELLSRPRATARSRSTGSTAPRRAIVALGSTAGTVKDVVDELRDEGEAVGLLKIVSFRPFPAAAVAAALRERRRPSSSSTAPTRPAARRRSTPRSRPRSTAAAASSTAHVYGLGGRDLHPADIRARLRRRRSRPRRPAR